MASHATATSGMRILAESDLNRLVTVSVSSAVGKVLLDVVARKVSCVSQRQKSSQTLTTRCLTLLVEGVPPWFD